MGGLRVDRAGRRRAYRRFGTTEIDRRLIFALPFTFLMQGVLATGGWLLGIPVEMIQILFPALWFGLLGMVALLAEPRIAPAVVGYLVAFLIAAARPEDRLYMISAGNAVLTINAVAWYRIKCRLAYPGARDAARS